MKIKRANPLVRIHPYKMCFQSNIGSFIVTDIYRFVGAICNPLKKKAGPFLTLQENPFTSHDYILCRNSI
jgi:hypothetical protein